MRCCLMVHRTTCEARTQLLGSVHVGAHLPGCYCRKYGSTCCTSVAVVLSLRKSALGGYFSGFQSRLSALIRM
eukprot:jgi/Botrbrau1/23465/Bobra.106_1s0020.1